MFHDLIARRAPKVWELSLNARKSAQKEDRLVGPEIRADGTHLLRPTCRKHVETTQDWNPARLNGRAGVFDMVGSENKRVQTLLIK